MKNNANKHIPWEDFADDHVLFMRPIDSEVTPSVFEGVLVQPSDFGMVQFRHGVVFVDDFLSTYESDRTYLDNILKGFGYDNLDDFVSQNSPVPIVPIFKENGDIDRENTPHYIVDVRLLASLIFENRGGDPITPALAAELTERLTGEKAHEFIQSLSER